MRDRIRFISIYFAFWAIYFLVARVIFLTYHLKDAKSLTLETVFNIFLYGFKMDLSFAGYLSVFPFLWVTFSNFIKKNVFQNTIFVYTFIMVIVNTLIVVSDLEVYNIWKFRLDATPLAYLKSPKEAWASIRSSPVIQLFLSLIVLIIIANYIIYRILANKIDNWKKIKNFPFVLYGLLLTGLLILPIRGGLGIAPMNQSAVYFSKNNFANIAAINASWNFFSSILNNSTDKVNPFTYEPKDVVTETLTELYKTDNIRNEVLTAKKPNVLIIIWESFTKKIVDKTENGVVITPNFNQLKKEGIYFSDFYASGDRTDKGLISVLSGYPAQPTTSIIKEPIKSASLPVLSKDFEKNGYYSEFYYGGDTEFANMKSYLFGSTFNNIIDKNNFPEALNTSKWGVHDQYIFERFINDHKQVLTKPFFSTLLTLSSHEPFDSPRKNIAIAGKEIKYQFENSHNYTDQCLGDFIATAKKQSWWKNTLIIIVADHGHHLPETNNKVESFKIPMLWLGGAIKSNFNYAQVGSQTDIPATLLGQLNINSKSYSWSKDLFKTKVKHWAYFAFNNGWGLVKPTKQMVYDNVGKRAISQAGKVTNHDWTEGKVLQQATFQDYLDR